MPYQLNYRTDSRKGPSLSKTSATEGWVEYLNTLGQVYYFPQIDSMLYSSTQQYLINRWPKDLQDNSNLIGWIQHLAQQRCVDDFVLPICGSIDPASGVKSVQCGNSRLAASIICGVLPDKIPMIAFSKSRMHIPPPAELLQSTQQFNKLFNLDNVDYQIECSVTDSLEVSFSASILRHTIYDVPDQPIHHQIANANCKSFWERFQQPNKKYKIQIHGTSQTKSFIKPSDHFEINYIEHDSTEWEMSYGMMLGEFDKGTRSSVFRPELQLWLYDITELVYLELMIPWMSSPKNFYKTQNEKVVIIDNEFKSNGMQIIGNWAK
jgi:hypothetical protein